MADQKRKTERVYIPGKGWTTSSIGAAEGAEDESATTKAKLQDVTGLAAAARRAKEAREKKATPTPRPMPDKVSMMGAPSSEAQQMLAEELRRRYGKAPMTLGRLYGGMA